MAATFRFRASLLVSLILITTPSQCPSFASPSNPNLESKADSGGSDGTKFWCAAKNNAEDSTLQTALDWACGAGGADCRALQQGGPCYNPQDIQSMASYAFNDYALKNGLSNTTCNFGNSAAIVTLDPSKGSCVFPARSV
uniref:X8 domain-containing protein n=1 Tax=Nelumbo nucifera TaxID=4432 RepID=A0A822XWT8_NELNU|nr:TPA_asm: hypothetical protein HUJ06_026244 [Nelumbo nucifera]